MSTALVKSLVGGVVAVAVGVAGLVPLAVLRAGRYQGVPPRKMAARAFLCAVGLGAWMAATGWICTRGWLLKAAAAGWGPCLVGFMSAATLCAACTRFGATMARGLPIAALVAFQVFRMPLELVLDALHHEGVVPVQMTFEGMNFDVVAGISAGLVAWLTRGKALPRSWLLGWNGVCLGLLATIVVVANLSTPAFHVFPAVRRTTLLWTAPFVWLPAVLVQAALFAHVLVFRKLGGLGLERQAPAFPGRPPPGSLR